MKTALVMLLAMLTSSAFACTLDGCDHPDCGSCGGACCKLSITIPESTESVMNKLNASIVAGGPDGLYTPMMTAEGTLTFGDLRPYGKPIDFIGQAVHTTINGVYNDTVNFSLAPVSENETEVMAFSISQIAGAYCDDGQNYLNILQLVEGVKWDGGELDLDQVSHLDGSCPDPASSLKK
ncbi:hypothetical protein TrVE_jg5872 [Triparma verrucosa]|uniref:Uncharacterized protein n=1 Tax=Triparma verrucosa TaxID=1606542 RepID=A0A9W7FEP7_9STRA|nr:hypothetical protein TrVE_jg5872 [Triparma verrucosa]|mmetsp:Transcript_3983/g.7485  ORF Transcript_3983/g.7485 Transcript_3983/m.7485 type:complete len:180 (-) Transcript_3983:110-649(-)|eukprot:CAMPEP_0182506192 /NCGR_PEP_ID=MMETSP1321-20130603/20732_1 /TAXON_ID=91990 /ORGANISM="Bolidomonas sp., Strain RCC1657" /LENGTH=179 /DNA_ID=CAMNT_0024711871 /DNA_START=45 /DNA_END=584 /DNA_ORIENTATION=+